MLAVLWWSTGYWLRTTHTTDFPASLGTVSTTCAEAKKIGAAKAKKMAKLFETMLQM